MVYDSEDTIGHIMSQSLSNYPRPCSQRYSLYKQILYMAFPHLSSTPLFSTNIKGSVEAVPTEVTFHQKCK